MSLLRTPLPQLGGSFIHLINLVFHEAGHIIFAPFGSFMMSLGGSLFQVLMPLVCAGAFLFQQDDPFGASVCVWWAGESLLDLAPYIDDARSLQLMLLGGPAAEVEGHDWEAILMALGWLHLDHTIARVAWYSALRLMLGALVYSFFLCVLRVIDQNCRLEPMETYRVPAGTGIGHVHLKVSDIDRALAFYKDVLGFDQIMRLGDQAAFVSAGGYHHHIGLNTWQSRRGSPAPPHHTGLYHFAIRYPTRRDLANATRRVIDAGVPLQGVADHGVSESIYLADLDGNGIELTRDRPESEWPRDAEGHIELAMADPLDLEALLREAE